MSLSQEKIRAIAAECVAVADDELHQQFLQYMGMAPQDFVALSDQSQQEAVAQASATAKRLAVVRAPEFIEWFGKSQLVDEHGEPMVFYHGTNNGGFTEFDRKWSMKVRRQSMDTVGIWFSDNPGPDGAGKYVAQEGACIIPVYLRAEKTKHYDLFEDFLRDMHEAEGRRFEDQHPPGLGSPEGLRAKLKAEGYDSISFSGNGVRELYQKVEEAKAKVGVLRAEHEAAYLRYESEGKRMPLEEVKAHDAKIAALVEQQNRVYKEINRLGNCAEFDGQLCVVVLEPDQIRSALGDCPLFGPKTPKIEYGYDQGNERECVGMDH